MADEAKVNIENEYKKDSFFKGFCWPQKRLSIGFPLLILTVGIYWLGNDLGLWENSVSIWAVLFIIFGVYWLIKGILSHLSR